MNGIAADTATSGHTVLAEADGSAYQSLRQRPIDATVGLSEYGVPAGRAARCDAVHVLTMLRPVFSPR